MCDTFEPCEAETKEKLEVMLDALEFYKDTYLGLDYKTIEILDEQIGAIRANIYGEEYGWRSKEGKEQYHKRMLEHMKQALEEALGKLYDIKYADSQKSIIPNPLFPNWYEKITTTYSDKRS